LAHTWNPEFRSNLVWAQTMVQDPKLELGTGDPGVAGTETIKTMNQAFVNTFWSFAKNAEFGVEYGWGQWKSFGSPALKGTMNRVNATFHYNFF
jgi:hypothetical protein